jgi:hypothetical protein
MPFSHYLYDRLGRAEISPKGPHVAGSHVPLVLTYTAGVVGIDDSGALKFSWRTASDSGKPQFTDPRAPNYTTAYATNGAKLHIEYNRNNIRPWVNTLFVRVVAGFLREGDQIIVKLGDPSHGSPGYRLQTCCDDDFQFKTFVDAFATYDFVPIPLSPAIKLISGKPARWKAYLPTLRRTRDAFRLVIVPEDRWGNPSDQADQTILLSSNMPVEGLPDRVVFARGDGPRVIDGLRVDKAGVLEISLMGADGSPLGSSNPLRLAEDVPMLHYWGDLHGQSNETVGTNTVEQYFAFARDRAFLDIVAHQGNDFQIDDELWAKINDLSAQYDEPGRFVALPAYEWSGNTGMGGDHNVYYRTEGRPIYRSSKVLISSETKDPVCLNVNELFAALEKEDAVVIAHVGGRYADISIGHSGRIQQSVEIHSCWGTFEWLLHDAFDLGYRVGLVCHSDDHKGRPGAAYPGASTFGAIGGLTCYIMPELNRDNLFEALRARRHYGTTGTRLYLDVKAQFDGIAERFETDPALGPTQSKSVRAATMGDIVRTTDSSVRLAVEVIGSAPIERVTIFNGKSPIAVHRNFDSSELGHRIRVLWEGAEYRGRAREVYWRGHCRLEGNRFTRTESFNLFNVDKPLRVAEDGTRVDFDSVTTGNFAGFDLWLDDREAGELIFASDVLDARVPIAEIGMEDKVVDAGGLGKRLRIFRLPDVNSSRQLSFTHHIELRRDRDNPIYVRVTQEDGHQAWSSPIYLIP